MSGALGLGHQRGPMMSSRRPKKVGKRALTYATAPNTKVRETEDDKCVRNYLRLKADPWNVNIKDICNPAGDGGQYIPASGYYRNQFTLGTAGAGYVFINPYTLWNDVGSVNVTGASYTGTGISCGATGTGSAAIPCPFAYASEHRQKTVAVGIKVWNMNAPLNTKGSVVTVRTVGNELKTVISEPDILSNRQNTVESVKPAATWITTYQDRGGVNDNSWITSNAAFQGCFGFYVMGGTAGDIFGYEVISHCMYDFKSQNFAAQYAVTIPAAEQAASKMTLKLQNAETSEVQRSWTNKMMSLADGVANSVLNHATDRVLSYVGIPAPNSYLMPPAPAPPQRQLAIKQTNLPKAQGKKRVAAARTAHVIEL